MWVWSTVNLQTQKWCHDGICAKLLSVIFWLLFCTVQQGGDVLSISVLAAACIIKNVCLLHLERERRDVKSILLRDSSLINVVMGVHFGLNDWLLLKCHCLPGLWFLNDLLRCWKIPGMPGVIQEKIKLYHDGAHCSWDKTMFALFLIWPGALPHLCSHLFATVNCRETDVSSIFIYCDSSIAHGQLPVFVIFWSPLHGMNIPFKPYSWWRFIYKSLCFFYLLRDTGLCFSSAPSDVTKIDFHTAFLDASDPAAAFYVRSGWRMAAYPACPKTIKMGNFQEKPSFLKALISRGVTDGTVVFEVLIAAQSSRSRDFGVRSVAGWTPLLPLVWKTHNPPFAEL